MLLQPPSAPATQSRNVAPPGPAADGAAGEAIRDRAVEAHGVGLDEAARPAHLPAVHETVLRDPLPPGGPAEGDDLQGEEPGPSARSTRSSGQPGAVEQDRLLRHPGEAGPLPQHDRLSMVLSGRPSGRSSPPPSS